MAQSFDLAAVINRMGAPFLRVLCEGRNTEMLAQSFDLAAVINKMGAPFLRVFCEGAGTTNA